MMTYPHLVGWTPREAWDTVSPVTQWRDCGMGRGAGSEGQKRGCWEGPAWNALSRLDRLISLSACELQDGIWALGTRNP
jgi:hypothetical protein